MTSEARREDLLLDEMVERGESVDELLERTRRLREAVSHNADLYRRDIQYALDLMSDVARGEITLDVAGERLSNAYQEGREKLRDWREVVGGDAL